MREALRFDSVGVTLGGRTVLSDVDAEFHAGERWLIIGPNGAGKTTLLMVGAGLLTPTRGRVSAPWFTGASVEGIRRMGGCVFYLPAKSPLYQWLSVEENVRYMGWLFGVRLDIGALDRFAVSHLSHQLAGRLSEGERVRVACSIAFSLLPKVKFLLLDEPTAAMDAEGVRLFDEQARLFAGDGGCVLAASHDERLNTAGGWNHALLRGGSLLMVMSPSLAQSATA